MITTTTRGLALKNSGTRIKKLVPTIAKSLKQCIEWLITTQNTPNSMLLLRCKIPTSIDTLCEIRSTR